MNISMILGAIVIVCTIYCLAKRYESKLVLLTAGFILSCIALNPMAALFGFTKAMSNAKIIEPIVASMGFAYVMKYTKCDRHLVHFLAKYLHSLGYLIIPGAVLVTAFINISITSSSGCTAAVGAILIPLLMRMGVHPAMAASAVFLGTFGSPLVNPGYHQVVIASEVSKRTPMEFVSYSAIPILVVSIVVAIILCVIAVIKKEHKGYIADIEDVETDFKVNLPMAIVPIVPIVILLLAKTGYLPGMAKLEISHAMIIGAMIAFIVTRKTTTAKDICKDFFAGMGEGFGHVYGIVTCSLIFVAGMNAIGLVKALITTMSAHHAIAKIAGTAGPFILATICGSGDAAAISFNTAVTVHAASFGLDPLHLGAAVAAAGGLGRTMSPIAGACIICSGYAGVNPIELAKRNAIPTIVGAIIFVFMSLYML